MICSRCKKRPAVVFVASSADAEDTREYCLKRARGMGIQPIKDMMNQMGITKDQLETMEDQLDEVMGGLAEISGNGDSDGDGFMPGGTATLPLIQSMFGGNKVAPESTGETTQTAEHKKPENKKKRRNIDTYCTDLTRRARNHEIDRIVGRDQETARVIQILYRRTKNNPCLIGESGIGKTAIAEGLAIHITEGNVPACLRKKGVHLLDLTALMAGTQFRGQLESRIKGLVDEVKAGGDVILFVDEAHNLVGTGGAEGSMNTANILKPVLSRGEIQVIGAITFTEYRRCIEKDSTLERRFQPVKIDEPSVEQTMQVLLGVKSYYEDFHRVHVPDDVIRRAVILSERCINDRFLPDKAINLLGEACASAALRNQKMADYDAAVFRLDPLRQQKTDLITDGVDPDYEKLAQVCYEIASLEEKAYQLVPEALGANVGVEGLTHVIELWMGIPTSRVQENELKKLTGLEELLDKKVIGQEEAVSAVAAAIRRSRVQISPRRRPASFIFVGPTGVGKTELAKVISEELFDTSEALIRLDMSEFMEKRLASRIIGSPPDYVSRDEAGQMTEKVRRHPYSVLLFDEIEEACPDVMDILLQILDEGRVTDAQGCTVNLENTIIVMASNVGSEKRKGVLGFARTDADVSREKTMEALFESLRLEFLSHVDEVIVFRSLSAEDYKKIAALMLGEYTTALTKRGVRFAYDEKTVKWLVEHAVGGKGGARDLRNLIRREVEDRITVEIVERSDPSLSGVVVTEESDEIKLQIV